MPVLSTHASMAVPVFTNPMGMSAFVSLVILAQTVKHVSISKCNRLSITILTFR